MPSSASRIEARASRIAGGRSAVLGLASTLLLLALVGAAVMRLADPTNFPSIGRALWWAIQTVTTVGYGDVVPRTAVGRIVESVEMALGVALVSLLTASVTSALLQRDQQTERARSDGQANAIMDALSQLDQRLERVESNVSSGRTPPPNQ
jgi:voltage-gated potassium channel